MSSHNLPPHNIDAEENVIGSLLIDGLLMNSLSLKPRDFYSERLGLCYAACQALGDRGVGINQITMAQELNEQGKLETVGGAAYLSHLIANCATSLDCQHYADIVKRLAIYRGMITAAGQIAALGYSEGLDVVETLNKADEIILSLRKSDAPSLVMTPKPEMTVNAGIYSYQWPDLKIEATVSRLSMNGKQSLCAEVVIQHTLGETPELFEHTKLNLTSNLARTQLAKALTERAKGIDWVSVLKDIAVLTIEHYRQGEPVVAIGNQPSIMERTFQLYPILEKGEPTTIFGPGGSGKSYLASYIAVLVQLNQPGVYDWLPECGNVLYLDWEASVDVHERRVWAVKCGLGLEDSEEEIFYRFCSQPLVDDIMEIQRAVSDCGANLVIIDSQVAASGQDPDKAETVSQYYNALRSLRCTTLTIDHIPKSTEGAKSMPFGSVFKWNRARSLFEVRQCQEAGENILELGLYHRKYNEGRLLKPLGLSLEFCHGANETLEKVIFTETDIENIPELAKGLKLKERMIALLRDGAMTVGEIAEAAETTQGTVRVILNRHKDLFTKVGNEWEFRP